MALLGSAAQGTYTTLCSSTANFTTYYAKLLNVLQTHKLDGLDVDIEEPINEPSRTCAIKLMTQLYTDLGPDFVITMAPVATALINAEQADPFGGISYGGLDAAATVPGDGSTKLVKFYNAQFYSGFGNANTTETFDDVMAAKCNMNAESCWTPDRVSMGVLDSPSDGSGWAPLGNVKATVEALKQKYPGYGGVSAWEYFDAGKGDGVAPLDWVNGVQSALAS